MPARNPHIRTVSAISGLLVFTALILAAGPALADPARLLAAIDGDSLRIELGGKVEEVRLIGIDAPEGRQRFGAQARNHVLRLCIDRELRLEYDAERRDRYGRLLAYVYAGEVMVNESMIRAGLALPLPVRPNTAHAKGFRRAEAEAHAASRGFWAEGGLDMTPAQWRKKHGR
jgi:micrococcal nuclease